MVRTALGLAFACACLVAGAQQSLEVIALRYRTAEQVLDALRPLVEPGGTMTGQGNQLILRVSPTNLEEIRRAIDAMDQPRRRLQISVRFDDAGEASRRDLEVSGSVSNRGVRIEGSARDSQRNLAEQVDYRVQAMDGGRATILTGGYRPGGFDVIPRVSGGMVSMDILAANAGAATTVSTASGRLGQWFELGAIDRSAAREERGIGSMSSAARSGSRRVWVKVDALD